ncbi:hypothetical protein HanIR_Chr06g0282851 [Helianthus annuus]|nr:hypothetical protein HanIR_Chr06g0282851 [Helianthus annuus]
MLAKSFLKGFEGKIFFIAISNLKNVFQQPNKLTTTKHIFNPQLLTHDDFRLKFHSFSLKTTFQNCSCF